MNRSLTVVLLIVATLAFTGGAAVISLTIQSGKDFPPEVLLGVGLIGSAVLFIYAAVTK